MILCWHVHEPWSLRKGKADSRICKIYDSPSIGEGESSFAISIGGVVDCSV